MAFRKDTFESHVTQSTSLPFTFSVQQIDTLRAPHPWKYHCSTLVFCNSQSIKVRCLLLQPAHHSVYKVAEQPAEESKMLGSSPGLLRAVSTRHCALPPVFPAAGSPSTSSPTWRPLCTARTPPLGGLSCGPLHCGNDSEPILTPRLALGPSRNGPVLPSPLTSCCAGKCQQLD